MADAESDDLRRQIQLAVKHKRRIRVVTDRGVVNGTVRRVGVDYFVLGTGGEEIVVATAHVVYLGG